MEIGTRLVFGYNTINTKVFYYLNNFTHYNQFAAHMNRQFNLSKYDTIA